MKTNLYWLCLLTLLLSCRQRDEQYRNNGAKKAVAATYSCTTPETNDKKWYTSGKKAPLLDGLGGVHCPVTSQNKEVQRYCDQGLMLSFGFNHAEAARSFYEATRLDPHCAMAWWGYAYVLGPNYNGGMEKDNFQRAYDAVTQAKRWAKGCTTKERDLIAALGQRYSKDSTVVRATLDAAYAAAMRKVYQKYPQDATIGALFAESIMDMHPWDLWKKDGKPQPWTPEIMKVLRECLQREPRHPGVNHFFVHATEMSQNAGEAEANADLLRTLVPGSGHLVHMPSHTYMRIGRYHDGVLTNQKAVAVDSLYLEACHAQGAYPLGYYPHNYHFIAACATLSGESAAAMEGALKTSRHAHQKLLRDPEWSTLQHYYSIPWYVEVKLGLWEEILRSKAPEKDLKYPMVVWHYARGMALLAQDKRVEAEKELKEIKQLMKDPQIKELTIWGINNAYDLCFIASKVLEGELLAKAQKYSQAVALLNEAVAREDALNYNEPPDWFFSVRHHLGAVLVESGQFKAARAVYEEDLKNYPKNGWALRGLLNVYQKLGDKRRTEAVKRQFETSWKYADFTINASRIL